jgi:hypothetical protein
VEPFVLGVAVGDPEVGVANRQLSGDVLAVTDVMRHDGTERGPGSTRSQRVTCCFPLGARADPSRLPFHGPGAGLAARHIPATAGWAALATFQQLDLAGHPPDGLLQRIWELRDNLPAQDASYVALAEAPRLRAADRGRTAQPGTRIALPDDRGAPVASPAAMSTDGQ